MANPSICSLEQCDPPVGAGVVARLVRLDVPNRADDRLARLSYFIVLLKLPQKHSKRRGKVPKRRVLLIAGTAKAYNELNQEQVRNEPNR